MADEKQTAPKVDEKSTVTKKEVGQEYELLPGKKHYHDGQKMKAGDRVTLNETQAKAFADKFQRVGAPPKPLPPGPVIAPTSSVPQDIGAKTPNPDAPDPNPGNKIAINK